jgi:hypothetical protein
MVLSVLPAMMRPVTRGRPHRGEGRGMVRPMTILALILSCAAAFVLLVLLWVRVTKRDQASAQHRKVTSHLDWRSPSPANGRARGKLRAKPSRA